MNIKEKRKEAEELMQKIANEYNTCVYCDEDEDICFVIEDKIYISEGIPETRFYGTATDEQIKDADKANIDPTIIEDCVDIGIDTIDELYEFYEEDECDDDRIKEVDKLKSVLSSNEFSFNGDLNAFIAAFYELKKDVPYYSYSDMMTHCPSAYCKPMTVYCSIRDMVMDNEYCYTVDFSDDSITEEEIDYWLNILHNIDDYIM